MNTKNISRLAVLAALLASAGAAQAFVGTIAVGLGEMNEVGPIQTAFSADAKLETEDMNVDTTIFYKPGKLRDEMSVGGQDMVTIRRFDLGTVWMVMPQNMYMEFSPDENNEQVETFQLIEREIVGQEVINGMETTKYRSVYEGKDGKFGGFTWFTADNIAVKAFMIHDVNGDKQRVMFEITELRRGDQADGLFEIPAGYQKFNMGNFGGMGAMGGTPPPQGQPGYGAPPPPAQPDYGAPPPPGQPGYGAPPPPGQPNYGAVPQQTQPVPGTVSEEGEQNFGEEITETAQETAEETALEETKTAVKEKTNKIIKGLFGR